MFTQAPHTCSEREVGKTSDHFAASLTAICKNFENYQRRELTLVVLGLNTCFSYREQPRWQNLFYGLSA